MTSKSIYFTWNYIWYWILVFHGFSHVFLKGCFLWVWGLMLWQDNLNCCACQRGLERTTQMVSWQESVLTPVTVPLQATWLWLDMVMQKGWNLFTVAARQNLWRLNLKCVGHSNLWSHLKTWRKHILHVNHLWQHHPTSSIITQHGRHLRWMFRVNVQIIMQSSNLVSTNCKTAEGP